MCCSTGEHRPQRNVIHGGSLHVTGQKVLNADSVGSATTLTEHRPILPGGGVVEVYGTFDGSEG